MKCIITELNAYKDLALENNTALFLLFSEINKTNTLIHQQPEQVRHRKIRALLNLMKKKNILLKPTQLPIARRKKIYIHSKLIKIRKNECHEMSLLRKQLLAKLTSKCPLRRLFFN